MEQHKGKSKLRAKLIRKKQDVERRLARVRYGEELERIDSEIEGMAKRQNMTDFFIKHVEMPVIDSGRTTFLEFPEYP
jgi:hypothetical protein